MEKEFPRETPPSSWNTSGEVRGPPAFPLSSFVKQKVCFPLPSFPVGRGKRNRGVCTITFALLFFFLLLPRDWRPGSNGTAGSQSRRPVLFFFFFLGFISEKNRAAPVGSVPPAGPPSPLLFPQGPSSWYLHARRNRADHDQPEDAASPPFFPRQTLLSGGRKSSVATTPGRLPFSLFSPFFLFSLAPFFFPFVYGRRSKDP